MSVIKTGWFVDGNLDVLIFHFGAAASRFSHPFLTGDIEKLYMYKIFRQYSYSAVYMLMKMSIAVIFTLTCSLLLSFLQPSF